MENQTQRKIILITGATSGIGKAAALELAMQGHHIILHGRDSNKINSAREEIMMRSNNSHIDTLIADLQSLYDVRQMAVTFNQKYTHLDVLINNAGSLSGNSRELTAEGNEKTIAVNLFAPFLLTGLLLAKLKASNSARIINISSSEHKNNAKPNFSNPQSELGYGPLKTYGDAKLFLILISQKLVRKLHESGIKNITVNTMHPGAVASNFSIESDLGFLIKYLGKLARLFFKSNTQGADTTIYLATSEDAEGVTGKYFIDRKPAKVGKKYNSIPNEEMIWDYCERQTGISIL